MVRLSSLSLRFAALSLMIALPLSAAAQDRSQARAAFGRGVSQFEAGAYQAALRSFQEAYRIAPHPSVRVNMANCYEQLDLPVEAVDHFERFLVEAEGVPEEQRDEVQGAIRRLRRQIGEVFFHVEPEGAVVTLDGLQGMRAPILDAVPLRAGEHTLTVRAPDYVSHDQTFQVRGGQRMELNIELRVGHEDTERPPVAEPPPEPTDETDESAEQLGSGDDESGDETAEAPLEEEEEPGPDRDLTLPLAMSGVTGGLILGAGIAGGVALAADADFEDAVTRSNDRSLTPAERNAARQDGLDADDRAASSALAADILIGLAAVSAGVTVYFFVAEFTRDPEDEDVAPATAFVPYVGTGTAGAALYTSF